jgi:hypothetical protein
MTSIDFGKLRKTRQPTRKEAASYRRWVKYLSDSKLTSDEIHRRAASYAAKGEVPKQ